MLVRNALVDTGVLRLAVLAAIAIGSLAAPISVVGAQDSPPGAMFRGGPARTGVYRGGGPSLIGLAWRAPTDGDVISSPTIVGGTVYVGSDDGFLYALNLETGDRKWRTDLGSPVGSSPAVAGNRVYASTRDGSIHALDATKGAKQWRAATGAVLRFPWGHENGDYYISSPNVVGSTVIVGAGDGNVYAYDAATGRLRWKATTGGRVRGSPAVEGGTVYVGAFDGRLYAFDLATGKERWRHDTEGATLNSADFGFDRRTIQSSPAVANGVVYVGARDGFLYAVDAATGARRWRFDHKVSWINSSPAVFEGVVFAGSSDAAFLGAVDTTGKEVWRAKSTGIVWSSPAVAGDVVYFGDGGGHLRAVDRRTGAERWAFRTGSGVFSSPAVSGEYVVVGSTDGSVYAVRAGGGAMVRRAVYFDSTLAGRPGAGNATAARYLSARGYQSLDSAALGAFLEERIADRSPSVVVFVTTAVSERVLGDADAKATLRRYLDAGGKVVWTGPPPGLFPPTFRGLRDVRWDFPSKLTGVPHDSAIFDMHGARATAEGVRMGLPPRWRDAWAVAPAGVTRVLGSDASGLASAWWKRYGGPEGTGFVRVPGDDPHVLYLAAEYRGR